jgi:hypothetical protein
MSIERGYTVRQSGLRFTAALQEMASSEIMEMVDAARLASIKASDPHPLIKAFVVGHEGESVGNLVGVGNVVKRWVKTLIRTLGSKIRAGLQLFHGHAATNAHEGRMPIGEVVGTRIKDIDGRESVVVACHIRPEFRHLPLDVASVETNVDYTQAPDGTLEIVGVSDVTGIALGNSAIDRPGFSGATLLGQLQAFESSHNSKASGSRLRLGYSNTDKGQLSKVKLA